MTAKYWTCKSPAALLSTCFQFYSHWITSMSESIGAHSKCRRGPSCSVLTCEANMCLATLGCSSGAPGHALAPVILRAEQLLHLLTCDFDTGFSHHQTCRKTHHYWVTSTISEGKKSLWMINEPHIQVRKGATDTQRRVKAVVYLSFNSDTLLCPLKRQRARAVLRNHLSESIEAGDNHTISTGFYNPTSFLPAHSLQT